jgi:hypothetical protein
MRLRTSPRGHKGEPCFAQKTKSPARRFCCKTRLEHITQQKDQSPVRVSGKRRTGQTAYSKNKTFNRLWSASCFDPCNMAMWAVAACVLLIAVGTVSGQTLAADCAAIAGCQGFRTASVWTQAVIDASPTWCCGVSSSVITCTNSSGGTNKNDYHGCGGGNPGGCRVTVLNLHSKSLSGATMLKMFDIQPICGSEPHFALYCVHIWCSVMHAWYISGSLADCTGLSALGELLTFDIGKPNTGMKGDIGVVASFPKLTYLDLYANLELTGTLTSVGNLVNLWYLDVRSNKLTGTIDALQNLINLKELYVGM